MDFDFLVCSLLGALSSMLLVWPPGGIFHTKCTCANSSGYGKFRVVREIL